MEDNNFLENIDFSENFLTQDKMKCELVLPTQCNSSVDSNETSVKHTTTRNCFSKIVQNPYTNGNKYNSPAFINPEIMKNTCSEKLPVTSTTGTGELKWDIDFEHVPNSAKLSIPIAHVDVKKFNQHSSPGVRRTKNPYSKKKFTSKITVPVQNNKKHYRSYNTVSPVSRKARLTQKPYASPAVNNTVSRISKKTRVTQNPYASELSVLKKIVDELKNENELLRVQLNRKN